MLTPDFLRAKFTAGLEYGNYLATGTLDQRANWDAAHKRVNLTSAQRELIGSFTREVNILVSSGIWCGDCVQQCPILDHFAHASNDGLIRLRFVDRDVHADLAEQIKVCGGRRVPIAIFMNEDFDFISMLGDKTLSRLRSQANKVLGAACALPGAAVPGAELSQSVQDWADELERVHLTLRLSAKLRERHGD
jgi:thioredoxin-like negative regulator of GroEL